MLEKSFAEGTYASRLFREEIAIELNSTRYQIDRWFENRRNHYIPTPLLTYAQRQQVLEKSFAEEMNPSVQVREELAIELNLTRNQIDRWFRNNRRRARLFDREESCFQSPVTAARILCSMI